MAAKVSIITPSFNSEKFISETIDSVLLQTYDNWEMVIIDDCSTDESIKIVKEFIKNDQRIRLIKNDKNEGAAVSRNIAIKESDGKYIAFLDSDDLWMPKKLEKQIAFMEENNIPLSYMAYDTINEEGGDLHNIKQPPEKLDYIEMLKENQIGCLTGVYNQKLLGKCYMPLIKKRQDYGLWLSILKKTPYGYKVPGVLAKYRIHSNSVSSSKIGLLKYNFKLFHEYEGISFAKSMYYVGWNVGRKCKKRRT